MQERLVFVYKSLKKERAYLYLREKDVFSHIPAGLLDAFGAPQFVLMFALSEDRVLPKVDARVLLDAIEDKGYYLRIDIESDEDNMLNIERKRLGLPPLEREKIADFFH